MTFGIIIYPLLAGMCIFIGGLAGRIFEITLGRRMESYLLHWTIAFGGGILVAAIAFVLTPSGIETFHIMTFSAIFFSGAVAFFLLDKLIEKEGGLLAQTMAMLLDFIPEAIALGAVFVHNHNLGILLALFIGFQNLPESFNAYFDLRESNHSPRKVLALFFALGLLGVVCALAGKLFLAGHIAVTNGIMLFAAGGILYLIFQDIAPSSRISRHWEPALGSILGFIVGMIGAKLFG